ncbi:MAG: hypothetical protein ACRC0X_02175 [Brevinema sp.]
MIFDLSKFLERLEIFINTQKGTVINNPDYGWDWDLLKDAILTRDKLIEIENSISESMRYFVDSGQVSHLITEVNLLENNSIEIVITSTVEEKSFTIISDPINLSSGKYVYVRKFHFL